MLQFEESLKYPAAVQVKVEELGDDVVEVVELLEELLTELVELFVLVVVELTLLVELWVLLELSELLLPNALLIAVKSGNFVPETPFVSSVSMDHMMTPPRL